MPWMLHGTPVRNGITRTRSQCAVKKSIASWALSGSTTIRPYSAPPFQPSRSSPAQTVPSPRSIERAASTRSEATAATKSNFDLEVDWVALARGRRPSKWIPLLVPDPEIAWDGAAALYALPAWLVKGSAPSADSGGAGSSSGIGSGGSDREHGEFVIV